jgi:hypothetical protein
MPKCCVWLKATGGYVARSGLTISMPTIDCPVLRSSL